MRFSILPALVAVFVVTGAVGQQGLDSDHDGLTDAQEQVLLRQFAPRFLISSDDCSTAPAEFEPSVPEPTVAAENSAIYGQAFPRPGHTGQVELHYYDLWRVDCGKRGHNLDAEHVSAVVSEQAGTWKALYWYAAAHEDTLCDASQVTRASTLNAETRGPEVWVSNGKHAAFLGKAICNRGCGADRCGEMEHLAIKDVINLGEASAPMNGALWVSSPEWPLADKLRRSDFGEERMSRVDRMAPDDIAWASPGKRPAQAAILGGDSAIAGVGTGLRATDGALNSADAHTDRALNRASGHTGNALVKAYRKVKNALHATARAIEDK
jgi:hypothetical protein